MEGHTSATWRMRLNHRLRWRCGLFQISLPLVTIRVSRKRRKKYIGHARLCVRLFVCLDLSLAAFPHYCTDPDVTWGMVGGALYSDGALSSGFAIGARFSLL